MKEIKTNCSPYLTKNYSGSPQVKFQKIHLEQYVKIDVELDIVNTEI